MSVEKAGKSEYKLEKLCVPEGKHNLYLGKQS